MSNFNFDFNSAGEQGADVIPDNTICTVQMTIKPGGAGPDGWLTRAKNGNSEHLNCEFIVIDGPHSKRKFWERFTVTGSNHADSIDISSKTLRAILESARGILPKDKSETAQAARHVRGWQDFDQLRFVARLGVEAPSGGYAAKNFIRQVITPNLTEWKQPEQIDRSQLASKSNGSTAPEPTSQPAPTNAIARPQWAQD